MSKDDVRDSVRDEFSKLSLDGKTAFLVEAIFSTAGSAINEIGTRLNNLVSLVTGPLEAADEESGATDDAESEGASKGRSSKSASSGTSSKAGGKSSGSESASK